MMDPVHVASSSSSIMTPKRASSVRFKDASLNRWSHQDTAIRMPLPIDPRHGGSIASMNNHYYEHDDVLVVSKTFTRLHHGSGSGSVATEEGTHNPQDPLRTQKYRRTSAGPKEEEKRHERQRRNSLLRFGEVPMSELDLLLLQLEDVLHHARCQHHHQNDLLNHYICHACTSFHGVVKEG